MPGGSPRQLRPQPGPSFPFILAATPPRWTWFLNCGKHGLVVIEDAAHAHGARWQDRPIGALGDFGSFSFHQSKNMTAGEGGILFTNDESLAAKARVISNQGRGQGGAWYEHVILGTNYRLTGWQAAVLLAQLARLPEQMKKRAHNAAFLSKALAQSGMLSRPVIDSKVTAHSFLFLCAAAQRLRVPKHSC
jgi:dTDP-4-amino-4,6-dideoxygalactose transaminase